MFKTINSDVSSTWTSEDLLCISLITCNKLTGCHCESSCSNRFIGTITYRHDVCRIDSQAYHGRILDDKSMLMQNGKKRLTSSLHNPVVNAFDWKANANRCMNSIDDKVIAV